MIKTVILLRHAKAEESYLAKTDFDRNITERGISDSQKMGHYFTSLNIVPKIIFSSDSARTTQTVQEFVKAANLNTDIVFTHNLYHALASDFLKILNECEKDTILIVGHNMGISAIADWLSETSVPELPTCGLVVLQFKREIKIKKGIVLAYQAPKKI